MVSTNIMKGLKVFVLLGYSICTLVFGILAYKRISGNVDDSIDIFNNWKTGAIQELTVSDTLPPGGYEELFNYTWPGIDSGCDCRQVSRSSKTLFKIKEDFTHTSCSQNELFAGCKNIKKASALNLDTWGLIDNRRMQIYALRSNETWAGVALLSGEECKDPNLKKCGSNPNNTFCTTFSKCPITSINIREGFAEECLAQNDCWVLSKTNGKVKIMTALRANEEDALPLADMRINEYAMCRDKYEDNITPGRVEFEWQNAKRSPCTSEGKLWKPVNKITEQELFDMNNLMPIIYDYLPLGYYGYGKSGQDYQWGLFARQYIAWHIQCRPQMPELLSKHKEIQGLKTAQLALLVATSIIGAVLGIGVSIMVCTDTNPAVQKALNWGGKILLIPFQVVGIILSGSVAKFLSGTALNGCSDDDTIATFTNLGAGAANAHSSNINGIITSIAAIVFDIFLLILSRNHSQQPYYPQVNVEIQAKNRP